MNTIQGKHWRAEIRDGYARLTTPETTGAETDALAELNRENRGLAVFGPDDQHYALLTAGEALELLAFLRENEAELIRLSRDDAMLLTLATAVRQRGIHTQRTDQVTSHE